MPPKNNKKQRTKKAILQALQKSLGVVTEACDKVGINRTTFYKYYNEDQEFRKAADEMQEVSLDFAESQLFEQMRNGSAAATIFYLKTKGKKRGYIEKSEIGFAQDGLPDNIRIEVVGGTTPPVKNEDDIDEHPRKHKD